MSTEPTINRRRTILMDHTGHGPNVRMVVFMGAMTAAAKTWRVATALQVNTDQAEDIPAHGIVRNVEGDSLAEDYPWLGVVTIPRTGIVSPADTAAAEFEKWVGYYTDRGWRIVEARQWWDARLTPERTPDDEPDEPEESGEQA